MKKAMLTAYFVLNALTLALIAAPPGDPPELDMCINSNCDTDGTGCLASNPGGGWNPPPLPDPNNAY